MSSHKNLNRAGQPPSVDEDRIDEIQRSWRREAPELDTSAIGILGRITRIASLAGRPIAEVFAGHGLERGEFDVLATLLRAGEPYELTPTDLYRHLLISSGGLTHRLNSLERARLISRVKSRDDKRSWRVRLSRTGRERVIAAYGDDLNLEGQLLSGLSERERASLVALLRKLHRVVELNCEDSERSAPTA